MPITHAHSLVAGFILTHHQTVGFVQKVFARTKQGNVRKLPPPIGFPTVHNWGKPEVNRQDDIQEGDIAHITHEPERPLDVAQRAFYQVFGLDIHHCHPFNFDIVPHQFDYHSEPGVRLTPIMTMQVVDVERGMQELLQTIEKNKQRNSKQANGYWYELKFLDRSQFIDLQQTAKLSISENQISYLDSLYKQLQQGRILPKVEFSSPR
jgi:hypothetical protein